MTLRERGESHSQGNSHITGSLVHRRHAEGNLPGVLGCKGEGGEIYSQAFKIDASLVMSGQACPGELILHYCKGYINILLQVKSTCKLTGVMQSMWI